MKKVSHFLYDASLGSLIITQPTINRSPSDVSPCAMHELNVRSALAHAIRHYMAEIKKQINHERLAVLCNTYYLLLAITISERKKSRNSIIDKTVENECEIYGTDLFRYLSSHATRRTRCAHCKWALTVSNA